MKRCSKCREEKPLSEFGKEKRTRSGLRSQCRECCRAYARERAKSPERMARNREFMREYNKRPTVVERQRPLKRKYQRSRQGKDTRRIGAMRRRSRLANLHSELTADQWADILAAFGYACAYCGKGWHEIEGVLEQEHITPVSQGGGYTVDNIVPACKSCNRHKAQRTPEQAGMTLREPLYDYRGKHSSDGNRPAKNDSAAA